MQVFSRFTIPTDKFLTHRYICSFDKHEKIELSHTKHTSLYLGHCPDRRKSEAASKCHAVGANYHATIQQVLQERESELDELHSRLMLGVRHNASVQHKQQLLQAIAAGLSPLDIGDDFGGSIRQPAHFCGVFGLKPTERRVPTTGHIPELPGRPKCIRQMLTIGPLARSVEDLRLCLQLIAGTDLRQPDIPPVPLDTPSPKSIENLRIAWTDEFPAFPVASEIKKAIQSVAETLSTVRTHVEKWVPKFDFVAAWQIAWATSIYNAVCAAPVGMDAAFIRRKTAFMFREATQGEREFRKLGSVPGMVFPIFFNPNLKGYFEALTERDHLIAQMERELEQWDAWLCPVAMTPAFTHRATGQAVEVEGRKVPYMMASSAYTEPFALTGHPVVVLPIGQTKNGVHVSFW